MKRLGAIGSVLFRHGFGNVAERLFQKKAEPTSPDREDEFLLSSGFPSPRRIRMVLEELGPSFVKLGQLMSTRADLFPPEYIEEFIKLQDAVPPIPFEAVKSVVEGELRKPLDAIFAEFSTESIAAASMGQVHEAKLFSGERVAVKIIRPGIEKMIREDIRLMYFIAEKAENAFETARIVGAANLVREFERVIFREMDMLIEAGSIEKFAAHFKGSEEIHIPAVHWSYCTKSILVMEYIDGIKMDRVEEIRAAGIDPAEVAMIGLRSFSRQLMEFGFFHADPHPGNTLVMHDGRVGLVDFGITGYLDEEMMRRVATLFIGYAEHDYDLVMEALIDAGLLDEETMDLKAFRTDLKDVSESFYGRSLQNISVKDVYDQVMHLVLKHRIRLPRNLLLLLKTFIQTEALGKILGSDAGLLEVTRPYAKALLLKGYDARSVMRNMGRDARMLNQAMRETPKLLNHILRKTAEGKQRIELLHGFGDLSPIIEKGINRFIVGLVVSASILAAALILNSGQKVMEFQLDFFGLRTVSLTAAFGLFGYVVATLLGVWLMVCILRSGKL